MERLSGEIANTKAAAATPGEDMLSDTLMERIRSSKFTPGKSPFQDTPSSEWLQSPADDNDTTKMDAVRKLVDERPGLERRLRCIGHVRNGKEW